MNRKITISLAVIIVIFIGVVALAAPLLFFGVIVGFCMYPIAWPRIKPKLQRFKLVSKKDKRIQELEAEVARLKGNNPQEKPVK